MGSYWPGSNEMQNWRSTLALHRTEVMFFVLLEAWQPCFIVWKRAALVDLREAVIGWFRPTAHLTLYFDVIVSIDSPESGLLTCSGLIPGGTQAYSSEAQPESSSDMECLWKSDTSFIIILSSWPGTERTTCSSRTHLQCTQIFLWKQVSRGVLSGQTGHCQSNTTECCM